MRIVVLISLLFPLSASARELRVPSEFATIPPAIAAAQDGDVVVVAPGTYHDVIDLAGKKITLRSSHGPAATILDGSTFNSSIVSAVRGESGATVVQGFTFQNGAGTLTTACRLPNARVGGAIRVIGGGISILECIFKSNGRDTSRGGAVFACDSDLVVAGSRFEDNIADHGAAVYAATTVTRRMTMQRSTLEANRNDSAAFFVLSSSSSLEISDCDFADHAFGGVLLTANDAATTSFVRSTFRNNRASQGGGLLASLSNSSVLQMSDCRFEGNKVPSAGGGMFVVAAGREATLHIVQSAFVGNEAASGGGLSAAAIGGRIAISSSRFLSNVARSTPETGIVHDDCYTDGLPPQGNGLYFGGGADIRSLEGGSVTAANCLFVHNSGVRAGGAHAESCGSGTVAFVNCTIVDNSPSGLHLRLGSPRTVPFTDEEIRITNSIVRDPLPVEHDDARGRALVTFSDVLGGFAGEGNIDVPPLFVDADGGDYRLRDGSACIDAGSNAAIESMTNVDLAGQPRFVDDPRTRDTGTGTAPIVDLGANEFQVARRRSVRK